MEDEKPNRADYVDAKEYQRAYGRWYDKNDPKRRARNSDPERLATTRAWYAANREAVLEQKKVYFQENKEQIREYQRGYIKDRYHVDPEFRAKSIERAKAGNKARRPPGPAKTKLSDEERKERHAARERQRRRANGIPERSASEGPQYGDYADKAEYRDAYNKWYQEKNRGTINAYQREYGVKNKEEIKKRDRKRRQNDPAYTERLKKYYRKNRALFYWHARARRNQIGKASPPWLTKEHWLEIEAMYEEARLTTVETGIPHAVDHISPLKGKKSCGLHVPWNLRVITSRENRAKYNEEPE